MIGCSMVEFYLLTISTTDARIKILFFTRIELTIFVLLIAGVRSYLLDHSGDEYEGEVTKSVYTYSRLPTVWYQKQLQICK